MYLRVSLSIGGSQELLGPTLDPRTLGMREVHRCADRSASRTPCGPNVIPSLHSLMDIDACTSRLPFVVDVVIATDIGDGQFDLLPTNGPAACCQW